MSTKTKYIGYSTVQSFGEYTIVLGML
jgi:hypothetical protein